MYLLASSLLLILPSLTLALQAYCAQNVNCNPPNCSCHTRHNLMKHSDIPQMVYFGFDDAVTGIAKSFYDKLFAYDRKNPNGCPIGMSLYVSHAYTDYSIVRDYAKRGFEMGVHSVTHTHITNRSALLREAEDQRNNIARFGNVAKSNIVGWRSPFLETAGDDQVEVLKKLGFEYDISLTYIRLGMNDDNPWPFTMDYGWPYNCKIRPCPREKHPGFWEVPVNAMRDVKDRYPCAYVDGCYNRPSNADEAFKYLMDNFNNAYKGNRAPFGLNMHYAWFMTNYNFEAMNKFINEILKYEDVYIITVRQVLEWMKAPTKLADIKSFRPWDCRPKSEITRITTQKPTTKRTTTTTSKPTTTTTTPKPTTTTTTTTTEKPTTTTTVKPTTHKPTITTTTKKTSTTTENVFPNTFKPTTKAIPLPEKTQSQRRVSCLQGINCHLPNCFCAGYSNPGNFNPKKIPQLVFLTFDGSVNYQVYGQLRSIFSGMRTNPNKCPIGGTMFVSQQGSSKWYIKAFSNLGLEIAMRGYSGTHYNDQNILNDDMLSQMAELSNMQVPKPSGWRSPNLKPLGDGQFEKVLNYKFLYDSTLTVPGETYGPKHWPHTLDFGWKENCVIPDCPVKAFPGLWEVPNTPVLDYKKLYLCNFVDGCINSPPTANDTFNFMWDNFMAHYTSNRAPFGLHFRHIWFSHPFFQKNLEGFRMFLDRLSSIEDVYIMSIKDVITWMKNPTSLDNISRSRPWQC